MKHPILLLAGLCLAALPHATLAQELARAGDDFQVNQYTTGAQFLPRIDTRGDGSFVVAWTSEGSYYGPDTTSLSIEGQCVDATGASLGLQFQINQYTTGDQAFASIVAQPDDTFVVVWESTGSAGGDTSGTGLFGRRFAADCATPLGDDFLINQFTTGNQSNPRLASQPSGGFVVVWESYGSNGSDNVASSIQARRFDSTGNALGDQFQVNTFSYSYQILPDLDTNAAGDFVVVWQSASSDTGPSLTTTSVRARRFDAAGTPQGDDFQVNNLTLGVSVTEPWHPSVGLDGTGAFTVAWSSNSTPDADDEFSIQARRYDNAGAPLTGQFQVNTYTTGYQLYPRVSTEASGDFLVLWQSDGSTGTDTAGLSIVARFFDSAGTAFGDERQVNSFTTGEQGVPEIARYADGEFIAVWQGSASPGNDPDPSIQGVRFATDSDNDNIVDELDNCPVDANPSQADSDSDGSGDPCDLCTGDDATGDGDTDGVCADQDCNDGDSGASVIDACGVCGGDNSTCGIFSDDFESGDLNAWSATIG